MPTANALFVALQMTLPNKKAPERSCAAPGAADRAKTPLSWNIAILRSLTPFFARCQARFCLEMRCCRKNQCVHQLCRQAFSNRAKLVMANARIAHAFFGSFAVRMHFFPNIQQTPIVAFHPTIGGFSCNVRFCWLGSGQRGGFCKLRDFVSKIKPFGS